MLGLHPGVGPTLPYCFPTAGKQYLGVLLDTKLNRSQKCAIAVHSLLFQTVEGVLPAGQEE